MASYLIKIKPESPKFRADKSLLLSTQMVAVALPGKCVLLRPILKCYFLNSSTHYISKYWLGINSSNSQSAENLCFRFVYAHAYNLG